MGINTLVPADMAMARRSRFSSRLGSFGTRCDPACVGFRKDGFTLILIFLFEGLYFGLLSMVLERLQIERLDSLHRPDASWSRKKWRQLLITLSKAGKVRHFGVSNQKSHDDGIAQNSCQTTTHGQPVAVTLLHLALKPVFMSTWKGQKQLCEMAVSLSIVANRYGCLVCPPAWLFQGEFCKEEFAALNHVLNDLAKNTKSLRQRCCPWVSPSAIRVRCRSERPNPAFLSGKKTVAA